MRIKDVCKNHPSDHYMLTPGTIKQLDININGSTIEAYTHAQPQEIHSFIKYVLPKHHKRKAPIIRDWIVQKRKHNRAVKYEEIFYFLDVLLNITPWSEQKFQEIAQRIYNTIFVSVYQICLQRIYNTTFFSVCQVCLTRTKRPGKFLIKYILKRKNNK